MSEKPPKPKPEQESKADEPIQADPIEQAKRIMKRLVETPYKPHKPLGKRPSKDASPTPKAKPKERPASKGRVHNGKTRN